MDPQKAVKFAPQISVRGIDLDGQQRLFDAKVLLVGMGGLGCPTSELLAASGIGQLTLMDNDVIEQSNLSRQRLYTSSHIGHSKAVVASQVLASRFPDSAIDALHQSATHANLSEQIRHYDLVIDCTDNQTSREAINLACIDSNIPLITGAAIQSQGQIFCKPAGPDSPCYRCYSRQFNVPAARCSEAGVLFTLLSVVASQIATLATLHLAKATPLPCGELMMFDATLHRWHYFNINQASQCDACQLRELK